MNNLLWLPFVNFELQILNKKAIFDKRNTLYKYHKQEEDNMIEQVSIKSYNGVTSSTRTSVENSVNDFKSQIKCNKEFLEGLTIHTVIDSKYLEGNSVFTKYAKESHEYKKRTYKR